MIMVNTLGCSCSGKTRARDAALNAIQSPLLDIGIERATGIVWNITGGTDLTLFEVHLPLHHALIGFLLLKSNSTLYDSLFMNPNLQYLLYPKVGY